MRLKSKKIIITGGASGIGSSICSVFASEGAKLVVADIDEDGAKKTVSLINESGGEAIAICSDISSEKSVKSLIEQSVGFLGGIDVLVNDAAAFIFGNIEEVTKSHWDKVFGVNVIGTSNMIKFSLPYLKKSQDSNIVNIASVSGFIAQPSFIPYNASKGALLQLTRCLALDLAQYNIRVNAVSPGAIYTPATEKHIEFEGTDRDSFLKNAAEISFLKRLGKPEEVAKAALFLASDDASFITGTQLIVDGGASV